MPGCRGGLAGWCGGEGTRQAGGPDMALCPTAGHTPTRIWLRTHDCQRRDRHRPLSRERLAMPKPFLVQACANANGQHRWLSEWHDTEREACAAKVELEALGWTCVTLTEVRHPPPAVEGRVGLASGGQRRLL